MNRKSIAKEIARELRSGNKLKPDAKFPTDEPALKIVILDGDIIPKNTIVMFDERGVVGVIKNIGEE